MRLLHAGLCHQPVRRAISARSQRALRHDGAGRQSLPLHRLSTDSRCGALARARAATTSFVERSSQPAPALEPFSTSGFSRPPPSMSACRCLRDDPGAKLVAGATDLGVESNLRWRRWPHLVSLEAIDELREFSSTSERVTIGAALPLNEIGRRWIGRARSVSRVADAVRVAADSQSRDARRQSRHRVAHRRRRAAAAGARRRRARRRAVGSPDDSAVVVLHRLSQDGAGGRRADHGCRDSEAAAAVRALLQGRQAAARRHQHGRGGDGARSRCSTAACGARGLRSAAWRRRRSESPRPKPPSPISRGTTRRSSACRRILDRTLQPMSDHRGSKEYRLEVSKSLVEKFQWEHAQ